LTGIAHLMFTKTGDHYTWKKVKTNVNNVIVGTLWIDHVGEVNIVNHSTKDNCRLVFPGYGIMSKNKPRTVCYANFLVSLYSRCFDAIARSPQAVFTPFYKSIATL